MHVLPIERDVGPLKVTPQWALGFMQVRTVRRVSNAALANAALVLSSKNWENIRDGVQRRKTNAKSLGPAFSLCRRAGIDAALAKADFLFAGAPTIENKIEQQIQNTKVASARVAFDTVRTMNWWENVPSDMRFRECKIPFTRYTSYPIEPDMLYFLTLQ